MRTFPGASACKVYDALKLGSFCKITVNNHVNTFLGDEQRRRDFKQLVSVHATASNANASAFSAASVGMCVTSGFRTHTIALFGLRRPLARMGCNRGASALLVQSGRPSFQSHVDARISIDRPGQLIDELKTLTTSNWPLNRCSNAFAV